VAGHFVHGLPVLSLRTVTQLIACLLIAQVAPAVNAAWYTWTGSSTTTPAWSASANWANGAPPTVGHSLVFTGTTRTTNTATSNYQLGGILFDSRAGAFTLTGTAVPMRTLTIAGDIINRSPSVQRIGGTTSAKALGLSYPSGTTPRLIDTGSASIEINAALSGSGATIAKVGTGTLTINKPPARLAFQGALAANEGTTWLRTTLNADATIASGATMVFDSGVGVKSIASGGVLTAAGTLQLSDSLTLGSSSVIDLTVPQQSSGPLVLIGGTAAFGGELRVRIPFRYTESGLLSSENPTVYSLFESQGGALGGEFTSVIADYDGQPLPFRRGFDGIDPGVWVSSVASDGTSFTFNHATGQLVAVPEPSTLVIAGIGVVMTTWNALKERRRRRRMQRPSFES
jgi:hypothetical protein